MPTWVPPTIVLGYFGLVTLMALVGVFAETDTRREAGYKVLRVLLPLGVLAIVAEGVKVYVLSTA